MSLFDFFRRKDPIDEPIAELIEIARGEGMDVFITETRRTAARQRELYEQGRTTPGEIVTWTKRSRHESGRAADVSIRGAPEYEDDPESWEFLGAIGEELGLRWGGSFGDYGHFEV